MSFDESRARDDPSGVARVKSSRMWIDLLLVAIPVCLLVLVASRPTDKTRNNGETASRVAPSTDSMAIAEDQSFFPQQSTSDASRDELAEVRMELQNALVSVAVAHANAEKQRRLAAEAMARNATVEKDAQALRKNLDRVQAGGAGQDRLRGELAQARQDLADIRRISANTGTRTAEVVPAQRVGDGILAAYRAAAAASLSTTLQALEERRKAGLVERELVAAREFIAQLEASASLASVKQADLLRSMQSAESAAKQAGEAIDRERQTSSALADALGTARRQRDAFQEEVEHVVATSRSAAEREQASLLRSKELSEAAARQAGEALDRERESVSVLADNLETARRERDAALQEVARVSAASEQATAARTATESSLAGTTQALDQERRKVELLEHDLTEARQSIATLETDARLAAARQADLLQGREFSDAAAKQAGEALDRERESASVLVGELETARRERDAALQEVARVSAASEEALEREREKFAASTRDLASARKDIDALKTGGVPAEDLRRSLAAAHQDMADMGRISRNAGTLQAALAEQMSSQETALEGEQAKVERLARDLAVARGELQRVKDEAAAASGATESSLAAATQAVDQERQKVGLLEHDLAEARQAIATLEASGKLAATRQAGLLEGRQLSDAAARQAGEALDRERENARVLADDVEAARRERDAARQELARASAASEDALVQEREKAAALTRDLASVRQDLDAFKRQADRKNRDVTKASATADGNKPAVKRKSAAKPALPKALTLPDVLRPTLPANESFAQ